MLKEISKHWTIFWRASGLRLELTPLKVSSWFNNETWKSFRLKNWNSPLSTLTRLSLNTIWTINVVTFPNMGNYFAFFHKGSWSLLGRGSLVVDLGVGVKMHGVERLTRADHDVFNKSVIHFISIFCVKSDWDWIPKSVFSDFTFVGFQFNSTAQFTTQTTQFKNSTWRKSTSSLTGRVWYDLDYRNLNPIFDGSHEQRWHPVSS